MEGQDDIEQQDREGISERFKMMPSVNFITDGRIAGKWYKADPPLCRDWARISSLDYFGRTLVEKLNDTKSVGVISTLSSIPHSQILGQSRNNNPRALINNPESSYNIFGTPINNPNIKIYFYII